MVVRIRVKKIEAYMIISFEGFQGTSKTTAAVATLVEQGVKQGKKIISNANLDMEYTKFSLEWFLDNINTHEMEDCILFLDELYQLFDSRNSGSKQNKLFSYFIVQTRKRGVDFYYCTHHIDHVELRLRRATDIRGSCRFYPELPCKQCKGIGKVLINMKEETCPRCHGFISPVDKKTTWGGLSVTNFLDRRYRKRYSAEYWAPEYWKYFDTRERLSMQKKIMSGIDTNEVV
jgi:hypothetical protein